MKKYISLLIYLLTIFAYSQNIKIVYNLKYHINLDTITNKNSKEIYSHIIKGIPNIQGELVILNEESNFKQLGYLTRNKNSKQNFISNYYSNTVSKKVYSLQGNSLLGDSKIIYDNMYYNFSDFNWELTKETKKIGNYICFKAVGVKKSVKVEALKRNFNEDLVAWYCPELPYSFGPELFVGLPGLVFEAYNANGQGKHWLIDKIIRNHKIEIIKPKGKALHYVEAEKMLLDDFNKFMKK
nr:GLPGLI family protein [uncultured Flavobacterium sp.]